VITVVKVDVAMALASPPAPAWMVVDPTIVVKVEPSLTIVENTGEVVTADPFARAIRRMF
jgi:hypothetical protein